MRHRGAKDEDGGKTSASSASGDNDAVATKYGAKAMQLLSGLRGAFNGVGVMTEIGADESGSRSSSTNNQNFHAHSDNDLNNNQQQQFETTTKNNDGTWKDPVLRFERHIPLILFLVSAFTRYYRLSDPPGVVFDEYHFGRFVNQYNAGTYLFDIHPPLGKLVLGFVGYLNGYDHTKCRYDNIQDQYGEGCKYLVLRATAAFFGTITTPVMYAIVRNWGGTVYAGLLGAALFLMDNLNLTESRLILIDSQLIFWCAASLLCAQIWWRRLNEHNAASAAWSGRFGCEVSNIDAERLAVLPDGDGCPRAVEMLVIRGDGRTEKQRTPLMEPGVRAVSAQELHFMMGERERNLWCILMGVVTSSALSIKWTTLATPGMIAVESFFGFFFLKKKPAPLLDLFKILTVAFALYYTWFAIHFSLLPNTGDGDAFMKIEFQRTLINNSNYDPLAPHPGYFATFFQLNAEMLSANARIDVRHNWESVWWEWPLNLRGLLYYSQDKGNTYTQTVYLLGNPIAIWLIAVFVVVSAAASVFYLRYKEHPELEMKRHFGHTFTVVGYCLWVYVLNLLPYILVNRSAFIYHYMPALMYAEIMTAIMVNQLAGPHMPRVAKFLIFIVLAGFLYYAPWVYALPLTSEGHARRRWYKRWD